MPALSGQRARERSVGGQILRNPGSIIDVEGKRVFDRDRVWHPAERLEVAGGALYYVRPTPGQDHFRAYERWLLPAQMWCVARFDFHDHFTDRVDWYIEMDFIEVEGGIWRVRDGYLDVAVWEGSRYEVWDADELAEGMLAGEISVEEVARALDSLNRLSLALKRNGYSGAALLAEYAAGLPH